MLCFWRVRGALSKLHNAFSLLDNQESEHDLSRKGLADVAETDASSIDRSIWSAAKQVKTAWKGIAQCSKVTRHFPSRAGAAIQFSAHLIGYGKTLTHSAQNAAVTLP
jgi:hypothetical protein